MAKERSLYTPSTRDREYLTSIAGSPFRASGSGSAGGYSITMIEQVSPALVLPATSVSMLPCITRSPGNDRTPGPAGPIGPPPFEESRPVQRHCQRELLILASGVAAAARAHASHRHRHPELPSRSRPV